MLFKEGNTIKVLLVHPKDEDTILLEKWGDLQI